MFRLALPLILESRDLLSAPFTDWPVLPAMDLATLDHIRGIAYQGEAMGRRPDVFLKVGDSNTDTDEAFRPLGKPGYDPVASGLADWGPELVKTWQIYQFPIGPSGGNSFSRNSQADYPGWFLTDMMDGLPDEIATSNAGIALILAGTNDHHIHDVGTFQLNLQSLVTRLQDAGIIPVLNTIPWDRHQNHPAEDQVVATFNQSIAELAEEQELPLMNLWRALEPLPNTGLKTSNPFFSRDYKHLSSSPTNPGGFTTADLQYGQNMRHLLTLQVLTLLRQQVFDLATSTPTIAPWQALSANQPVLAIASGIGLPTVVTLVSPEGRQLNQILPYGSSHRGGASVAVGDWNLDAVPDVVVGAGPNGGPHVTIYSGVDGREMASFFAYEPTFTGGVSVALGDATGDGIPELVVGAGSGGGPRVRVFQSRDLTLLQDFFAFETTFLGGVSVAVGNTGIIVGTGSGGGPVVKVYKGSTGREITAFLAYDPALRSGVRVAVGDRDADGQDEIVTVPGADATPHVRVFQPDGAVIDEFFAEPDQTRTTSYVAMSQGRIVTLTRSGLRSHDPVTEALPWHGSSLAGWMVEPPHRSR